jgi:hypothetical protein
VCVMASLLIPSSSCCSSPKLLLHSRGSASSSSLLMLLRSLCSSSHPNAAPTLYGCAPASRVYQHRLRAFHAPNPAFRIPVLRRYAPNTFQEISLTPFYLSFTASFGENVLELAILDGLDMVFVKLIPH